MKLLNFACGGRFHPDWTNIDFSPIDKRVKKVNLLGKLPYTDESFDVAYSSHFLEHLTPNKAFEVLQEMKRILKPGGIIRLVVPDLENMVCSYLHALHDLNTYHKDEIAQIYGGRILYPPPPPKNIIFSCKTNLNMTGLCLKSLIKWCVCKVEGIWQAVFKMLYKTTIYLKLNSLNNV